ncbi:Thioesterase superfamily [Aspergillus sp. HF37]|nr:Thioesterase superfamily [Aspergillus sp. HF37]
MVVLEPHGIAPQPVSQETRVVFESHTMPSWCLKVLRDPTLRPIATPTRQPKASTEDSFVAETLATGSTISTWQSFYKAVPSQQNKQGETLRLSSDSSPVAGELVTLLALGRGMNGHTNVVHGGLIATILDETMGMVAGLHQSPGMSAYTAAVNVSYKKPVPAPGAIVCRTWLEKRSGGRKLWLRGRIEDGEGTLYADAESLWVEVKRKVPKL